MEEIQEFFGVRHWSFAGGLGFSIAILDKNQRHIVSPRLYISPADGIWDKKGARWG